MFLILWVLCGLLAVSHLLIVVSSCTLSVRKIFTMGILSTIGISVVKSWETRRPCWRTKTQPTYRPRTVLEAKTQKPQYFRKMCLKAVRSMQPGRLLLQQEEKGSDSGVLTGAGKFLIHWLLSSLQGRYNHPI